MSYFTRHYLTPVMSILVQANRLLFSPRGRWNDFWSWCSYNLGEVITTTLESFPMKLGARTPRLAAKRASGLFNYFLFIWFFISCLAPPRIQSSYFFFFFKVCWLRIFIFQVTDLFIAIGNASLIFLTFLHSCGR